MLSEKQQAKLKNVFSVSPTFERQLIALRCICAEYADHYGFEPKFIKVLMESGIVNHQGKALTPQLYKITVNQLIQAGFSSKKTELIVPAELHHAFLNMMGQSELDWVFSMVDLLVDADIANFSQHYSSHSYAFAHKTQLRTRLMKAVYANEPAYFLANSTNPYYTNQIIFNLIHLFGHIQFDRAWITSRHEMIQYFLSVALLSHHYFESPAAVSEALVLSLFEGNDWFLLNQEVLHYYSGVICLSLGDLARAQRYCQAIKMPDSGFALSLQASILFLNNELEPVSGLYRKALTALRKQYDARTYYFDTILGIFHGLNLAYTEKNPTQMTSHHDQYYKFDQQYNVMNMELAYFLLPIIILIEQGDMQSASMILRQRISQPDENTLPSMTVAILHLLSFMANKDYLIESGRLIHLHALKALKEKQILIAHLLYELLVRVPTYEAEAQAFLAQSPISLRFLEIIHVKEAWEYSFQALAGLLIEGGQAPGMSAVKQKRLLWLIDTDKLTVDVVEQSLNKSGWSFGKTVNLSKLADYHAYEQFGYLTAGDKAAISCLTQEYGGWHSQYGFDDDRALLALVGHPHLAHAKNRSVMLELVRAEPILHIEEHAEGFQISLSHWSDKSGVMLEPESMSRYRVIDFSSAFVSIGQILTEKGLIVPAHAKDKILAVIQQAKRDIQLHVGIQDMIPEMPGDPTPCIQLLPMKEGIRATLWVRPLPEQGSYYKIAQGKESVMTILVTDGVETRARVIRDLSAEQVNQAKLILQCPRLSAHEIESGVYETDTPEETLEVLSELQNYAAHEPHEAALLNIEWPQGQTFKIKQRLMPGSFALNIASGSNWFEYDGKVTLDDGEVMSMQVLIDSINMQSYGRFVRLGNGEFIELTSQLKKQLNILAAISDGNKINSLGAQVLSDIVADAEYTTFDAGWEAHLEKIKNMDTYVPKIPSTLQATLRDYQIEGYQYLSRLAHWGIGACLADDMGLGKTIQMIALLLERAKLGAQLVIAPTSVGFNWIEELNKFAPTLNVHHLLIDDRAALIDKVGAFDVIICSYGLLQHNNTLLTQKMWETIVLDEAQAIKNANTLRWKAVMALKGNCRIALSGTPIENHLGELWSIFSFINPGLLGTIKSFQTKFALPIETRQIPERVHALKALVSPYILRRIKSDVLSELPPKTEQTIHIEQSEEEALFYEALRRNAEERVTHYLADNNRIAVLAEISKLRQACCDSSLVDSSLSIENSKLNIFIATLKNIIENGHKALVFSQYVSFLKIVKQRIEQENITYQYLDGSTSSPNRKKAVNAFQAGDGDVFLLSLKAGGSGLNLTAADYVIHLDPWWNPAVEDQASDRAHRIGQERPVTIYRLVMQNTIEEKIISLHEHKRNLANELLSGHGVSGKLSDQDLMNLIYSAPVIP